MARSHGGGRACYKGFRPNGWSCIPCRRALAKSKEHSEPRYLTTALYMLKEVRQHAKKRLG